MHNTHVVEYSQTQEYYMSLPKCSSSDVSKGALHALQYFANIPTLWDGLIVVSLFPDDDANADASDADAI